MFTEALVEGAVQFLTDADGELRAKYFERC
jgi:hypothetical protein